MSTEELQRLSAANPIDLGFPRNFLESDHVYGLIFGDTYPQLDNHRKLSTELPRTEPQSRDERKDFAKIFLENLGEYLGVLSCFAVQLAFIP